MAAPGNLFRGFIQKLEYINFTKKKKHKQIKTNVGDFYRDFCSDLPFPVLARAAKYSSQVSLELRLFRGEVVEKETFTQREEREKI